MKVCPTTSINHFRYYDRYQNQLFSWKAAGEGEGEVGKVMVSELGISGKAGWKKQSWSYIRKEDHARLCPSRPYLPFSFLQGIDKMDVDR